MKKSLFLAIGLIVLAAVFTACPDGTGGLEDNKGSGIGPEGPKVNGVFLTAPALTFSDQGAPANGIRYSFTAATLVDGVSGAITYRLFYAKEAINKSDDIIANPVEPGLVVSPGTTGDISGDEGAIYSAVVFASIMHNGEFSEAYSAVRQSQVASSVSFENGTGTLQSAGPATAAGAFTYYIDYERGDDNNTGRSPKVPWKTLTKANKTAFYPGDRILLEANSTWNGIPTVGAGSSTWQNNAYMESDPNFPRESNYQQFMTARGNGGILAPMGNGTAADPIIIDLYEFDEETSTVYWSANRRPVINGNGTPALPGPKPPAADWLGDISAQGENCPYWLSGAVHFEAQDYWQVRNIELTNSYDFPYIAGDRRLRETHMFRRDVPKDLAGVAVTERRNPKALLKGIVIEHCYIHDTQSIHQNNAAHDGPRSNEFPEGGWYGRKNGAITASFTESTVQYNIIRNIGLEGIIAGDWDYPSIHGSNTIIRGNYLENIAGNAIVINYQTDTLIESNIAKDPVCAPNLNEGNYASIWCYNLTRGLFQYNESYGTMYGNADGEAWDVDDSSNWVIYQYNYSHHNAGGTCLFMTSQTNSIFRYNISVNDGSGPAWLDSVNDYDMTEWFGQIGNTGADQREEHSYAGRYPYGNHIFHSPGDARYQTTSIPLIHNNTIYIGDGYEVAILGNLAEGSNRDKRARFFNNIILKEGSTGNVRMVDSAGYVVGNFVGVMRNNIFWSTDNDKSHFVGPVSNPNHIDQIVGNTNPTGLMTSGNMWANPRLKIQSMAAQTLQVPVLGSSIVNHAKTTAQIKTVLKDQVNEGFPEVDFNDAAKLKTFVGLSRLRIRAQYFSPEAESPAIEGGYVLPVSTNATQGITVLDNAWNGHNGSGGAAVPAGGVKRVDELSDHPTPWSSTGGITHDFFGKPINSARPPIGAAAGPYQ